MTKVAFNPAVAGVKFQPPAVAEKNSLNQRVQDIVMAPFRAIYALYDIIRPENPLTKERQLFRFIPERLEIAVGGYGYRNYIDARGGEWSPHKYKPSGYNAMVKNYKGIVDQALKKIIPHTGRPQLPWEMRMIDTQTVNAWARMGGKMAIHRALIERMDIDKPQYGLGRIHIKDKIAAVVGHEAVHPAAGHSARLVEMTLFWGLLGILLEPAFMLLALYECHDLIEELIFSRYGRSQEFEADRYGMELMWKAGYDPKAAIWVQKFLKEYENSYGISWMDWIDRLFWSHPTCDERIAENKITLAQLQTRKRPAAATA